MPLAAHRRTAALAVAAAGLTGVFSSALVPTARAALTPVVERTTASTVSPALESGWFVDPRTPAERRAQVAVPRRDPKKYDGSLKETRAAYRTRAGDLAVPVRSAFGHTVEKGQALTLNADGLIFESPDRLSADGRRIVSHLALALAGASSLRCEGYADYRGAAAPNEERARRRAETVCSALTADIDVRHTEAAYTDHPAVVGGTVEDRSLNRRVVVQVTGTRVTTPVAQLPGAPTLAAVEARLHSIAFSFVAPTGDGGSPITGYEVSTGDGWVPVEPLAVGVPPVPCASPCPDGQLLGTVADLPAGPTSIRVRAVNAVGAGAPSNSLEATVLDVPSAPTGVVASAQGTTVTVSFVVPASDGGAPVTWYEVRVDGGAWTPVTLLADGTSFVLADQTAGNHTYEVRAGNGHGTSAASAQATAEVASPQPDAPTIRYFGYNSWYASWQVAFDAGATNGATVTGWEASVEGGPWVPAAEVVVDGSGPNALFPCPSGDCGWSYQTAVRLRAVTATGHSEPSQPYVHDDF